MAELNLSDKRDYTRMDVFCEMQCKAKKEKEIHRGWITSLSGSGISFLSEYKFTKGEEVKVTILAEKPRGKVINFNITVVRSFDKDNNFFAVAATLNKMKDSEFVALSYRING